MPLTLERIMHLSPEDFSDLEKIYHDHPQLNSASIRAELDKDNACQLYAGRFNGRLLAAIWGYPQSDNSLRFKHLQVRDITRRRGVAKQLLELLCQQAKKQQQCIYAHEADISPEALPITAAAGFHCKELDGKDYIWVYND